MKTSFSIQASVWIYPGDIGWHFVNIPKDISALVRAMKKSYGAGFIKVKVTLGESSWKTALFYQQISTSYILPIKKAIRKTEGVFAGDTIDLRIDIL